MNKHLLRFVCRAFALFTMLSIPLSVHAAAVIEAHDSVAGLGVSIELKGLPPAHSFDLVVVPPFGPEMTVPVSWEDDGSAEILLSGSDTELAGAYSVALLKNEEPTDAEAQFAIFPESVDPYNTSIETDKASLATTGEDELQVTVILRDRYGNPLPNRPVELISSRASDMVAPLASETDENGEQFFVLTTHEPGLFTLRAIDLISATVLDATTEIAAGDPENAMGGYVPSGYTYQVPQPQYIPVYQPPPAPIMNGSSLAGNLLGRQLYGQVTNSFDVVAGFEILAPEMLQMNEDATITITAVDSQGRRVEDYAGMVVLSSTDPDAFLPLGGEIQFLPQNLGEKTLTLGLRFRTPSGAEPHLLVARDSVDPSVEGITEILVGGDMPSGEQLIEITSHEQDSLVSSLQITLEGSGPPFINLIATGGVEDATGETDSDGNFSIPVVISKGQIDHTLRIRDDSGRYDSGNLHLILDSEKPEVISLTFTPSDPEEGEDTLLVVNSEVGLADATLDIGDKTFPLETVATSSGTYQTLFKAPKDGTYQPVITLTDVAGNETEIRSNLVITPAGLPQVQNVKADVKKDAVILTWDSLDVRKVDSYRVYVGDAPDNFLYSLDTKRAVTSATVSGLVGGATYYFALTGLEGERESIEKSEIVEVTTVGIQINVTPSDGTLMLEWSSLANGIPLSSFLLEYGVEPDSFTEQRTLNGEMRTYALRDLLNDVTYYVRLTPVTTTGEVLRDLASTGQGTPTADSEGFRPAAAEPVPFDFGTGAPPPPDLHKGAPAVSETGIPIAPVWLAVIASMLFAYYQWHRRRKMKLAMDFLQTMENQYKS